MTRPIVELCVHGEAKPHEVWGRRDEQPLDDCPGGRVLEGAKIWWCEAHNRPSLWIDGSRPTFDREPFCDAYLNDASCRMVEKLLVPVDALASAQEDT